MHFKKWEVQLRAMTSAVSWMVAPQRYVNVLIPRTCDVTLFGKRIFTDVIQGSQDKEIIMDKLAGP